MQAIATVRGAAVGAWTLTAVTAPSGGALPSVLYPESTGGRAAVTAGLWVVFVVVLAALFLPGARALTVVRIAVPANAAAQLWALAAAAGTSAATVAAEWTAKAGEDATTVRVAATGAASWTDPPVIAAALVGLAGALVVLLPAYGDAQVDAGSYGDERRFLLRPPGPILVALVVPMWAVAALGAGAGPLLLAGGRWRTGAAACAFGLPAAAVAAHALFRLARRWLVFVPSGVVVHDHLAVAQPLPLSRRGIASVGPAPAATAAADLTAQAFGMALELRLAGPVAASVVTGRNRREERTVTAILVSPSRPAAVMATASRRGIKIG